MEGSPSYDADKAMSQNQLPHPNKCGGSVCPTKAREPTSKGMFVVVCFDVTTVLQLFSSQEACPL